jgi:hypothetical protein
MTVYDMGNTLAFSRGVRENTDLDTIKQMLPGCVSVEKAEVNLDKQGVDYIATLRRGRQIYIDAKARTPGCSRFWTQGPEVALETWSVKPERDTVGKVGWTLDESKQTELVLFTFDKKDHPSCYLVSFQLLRCAFHRNYHDWRSAFQVDTQKSNWNGSRWKSECVFVPIRTVYDAIQAASMWTLDFSRN